MLIAEMVPVTPAGVVIVVAIIVVIVALQLKAADQDQPQIEADVKSRGGRVESIQEAPFSAGPLGKGKRFYEVRYVDAEGRRRRGTCHVSYLSGVYWINDDVESAAAVDLAEENERLRRELEELKKPKPPF